MIGVGVVMWKKASNNIELLFVFIALVRGIFRITVTPNRTGVSWDDEIHYERTLEISDFLNGVRYRVDKKYCGLCR